MDINQSDVRCCILIRAIRSSTPKETVNTYCETYGQINYSRCAINPQGIMRGYNVVFKQEQSVNRFMDARPHHIDGQSVKVRRCIPSDEEWRLTREILITASDSSNDKQIFNERILCDYFSRYGAVRTCEIDIGFHRSRAYLTFADYDRVDQLINDKPHTINKIPINVRKHVVRNGKTPDATSKQTPKTITKRHQHSTSDSEHRRTKHHRSELNNTDLSSTTLPSKIIVKQQSCTDTELVRLKNANDLLIREVQSLISTPTQSVERMNHEEISHLQNDYERLNTQTISLLNQQNETLADNNTNEMLNKLANDVENLLKQIKTMQQQNKTFADELFEKYTIEYILALNEKDVQQRLEELEKENQLLLLIKQNMPKKTMPSL